MKREELQVTHKVNLLDTMTVSSSIGCCNANLLDRWTVGCLTQSATLHGTAKVKLTANYRTDDTVMMRPAHTSCYCMTGRYTTENAQETLHLHTRRMPFFRLKFRLKF